MVTFVLKEICWGFFLSVFSFLTSVFPFLEERYDSQCTLVLQHQQSAAFRDKSLCRSRLNHFASFVRGDRGLREPQLFFNAKFSLSIDLFIQFEFCFYTSNFKIKNRKQNKLFMPGFSRALPSLVPEIIRPPPLHCDAPWDGCHLNVYFEVRVC